MLKAARRTLAALRGYRLVHTSSPLLATDDLERDFLEIYERCRPFTMTSQPRMYALYQAVRHVVTSSIPGAIVECGVWRGGSAMLAALTLLRFGDQAREIFLYDTYAGMVTPTEVDVDPWMAPAIATWRRLQRPDKNEWCYAPLDEVTRNLRSTGYPIEKLRFVQGRVEETIPGAAPKQIAVLRLDTDWYESTRHELTNLYPLVARNGVLIIDDYGYWAGARKAVDEYFAHARSSIFLHRIDSTGRVGIKTSG
jgi:O-methyltransferase